MKRNNTTSFLHKNCNICGRKTTWTYARTHAGKCKACADKRKREAAILAKLQAAVREIEARK
jgi:hypothetical protein